MDLLEIRLLNMSSLNSLLFESSKDEIFSPLHTIYNLNTFNQPISAELWMISIIAAVFVGMAGMLPLIFIPFTMQCISSEKNESSKKLRLMLSFAVGGLLGDVFLHLLPEAWDLFTKNLKFKNDNTYSILGCWVLFGNATFIMLQMIFTMNEEQTIPILLCSADMLMSHWFISISAYKINIDERTNDRETDNKMNKNVIVAYLNLLANGIDNFSHGLAVGASFVIGYKVGILTTIAIIFHEVPHEFADFAILMKSGISKWNAIKAQLLTASIGIFGTIFSLICESYKIDGETSITSYILPFTAGGFLHIALTSILPELIKEDDPIESIKQLACIMLGVLVMGTVNCLAA